MSPRLSIVQATRAIFTASAAILLPVITVLITADALLRYLLNAPISWAQDLAGLCLFLLFCAGLTHSMAEHMHVRMDFVYDAFPAGLRRLIDIVSGACALMFSGILGYQAVFSAHTAWQNGSLMPTGEILIWPFSALGAMCLIIFGVAVIQQVIFGE